VSILNIRGTSGSGKSTLVRLLMEHIGGARAVVLEGMAPVPESQALDPASLRKTRGYALNYYVPKHAPIVAVVGKYQTACGGCDTIKTQEEIGGRVREFSTWANHVVFEGLLVSQIYDRYRALAHAFDSGEIESGHEFIFASLTTPLEVCIERVNQRRLAAGNDKPWDPENSLAPKWRSCQTNLIKARRDKLHVVELDWHDPLPQVLDLLRLTT
jgi:hypothetical protein